MSLLFPLGLAALAGLVVPLLIHLARRTEQRPTDFAALRWLRPRPRPRHRPRFDEWLLLAIRLLLIAAVALTLAQPMRADRRRPQAWVAVAPGASPVPATGDAHRVWLAPGFPTIAAPRPAGPQPVASLLRQLDAELPAGAALTVVVPRVIDGVDAERPRLSRRVTWRIAGEGLAPGREAALRPPALRYDPAHPGARYVLAAVRALGGEAAGLAAALPRTGPIVWWSGGPPPAAVIAAARRGRTILVPHDAIVPAAASVVPWRDAAARALVEAQPLGRGRLLRFTRALDPATMPELLEPDVPHRLAALIAPPPAPARADAAAYAPTVGGASLLVAPAIADWRWLAVAAAGLFAVERLLATRPRRAAAP